MKGVRKEGDEKGGNLRRKRTINLTNTYHVSHICLCVCGVVGCVCVCVCVWCVWCVCVKVL